MTHLRVLFALKAFSQCSHLNGKTSLCVIRCAVRLERSRNLRPHSEHAKDFSWR
jgi:hypothetical protein